MNQRTVVYSAGAATGCARAIGVELIVDRSQPRRGLVSTTLSGENSTSPRKPRGISTRSLIWKAPLKTKDGVTAK